MESRFDQAAAEHKLYTAEKLDPLKRFQYYLIGAVALALFLLSAGGFWIKSTISDMSETIENAKELAKKVDSLKKEVDSIDANISQRVKHVEQSVERIVEQTVAGQDKGGSITAPNEGAIVGGEFQARGTVALKPGQIAWLAVRIGKLYWPQKPAISSSGPWERQVFEGGAPGRKSLVLLTVDSTTNNEIIRWFETGHETGSFPGLLLEGKASAVAEIGFTLQ